MTAWETAPHAELPVSALVKPPARPKRIMMSTIQPKATAWLCEGRIQAGAIISMEGLPGCGKSTVATELVACVTTGRPMFGDVELRAPKGVNWIGHEERLAESIRPRLDAAGADASKVAVYQDPPEFPRDYDWLEREIREIDSGLVVVDPIDAYLTFGGQSSSNNNADVRSRLLGLAVVADRTGATIIMVRHHRKAGGVAAVYRGAGSLAYSAVARTIISFFRDPDDKDRRVMSWSKMNEAKEPSSLVFSIGEGRRVVWLGEDDRSAQEMMDQADERGGNREPRAIDRAVEWLQTELADGPRPSREVEKAAKDAGISRSSYDRARAELRVKSERRFEAGEAHWYIYLAARASATPPISDVEALESLAVVADVLGPQESQGTQESTLRGPEALGDQEVFS